MTVLVSTAWPTFIETYLKKLLGSTVDPYFRMAFILF